MGLGDDPSDDLLDGGLAVGGGGVVGADVFRHGDAMPGVLRAFFKPPATGLGSTGGREGFGGGAAGTAGEGGKVYGLGVEGDLEGGFPSAGVVGVGIGIASESLVID